MTEQVGYLELAAALAAAGTVDEVVSVILDRAARAAGADLCVVAIPAGRERRLRMAVSGLSDDLIVGRWTEIDLTGALPLADAIVSGRPVLLGSEPTERYAHLAGDRAATGIRASASFPMTTTLGPLGGLGFAWREDQPYSDAQVAHLGAVADLSARAMERVRFGELARRLIDELRGELLRARVIDTSGLEVVGAYRPAWAGEPLGGDWYDALELPDGTVALIVGDVAGHGVTVAPRMVALRHITRILVLEVPDPVSCLNGLDAAIRSLEPGGVDTLVAAMIAVIDRDAGRITWANAGLPDPLLRHPDGTVERLHGGRVPLLGAGVDRTSPASVTQPLPAGTTLVIHTDGLDPDWHEDDTVRDIVSRWEGGELESLLDALLRGRKEIIIHGDDAGMLVARARDTPGPAGGPLDGDRIGEDSHEVSTSEAGEGDMVEPLEATLPNDPSSPLVARRMVAGWIGDHPARDRVVLAVSELVSNAVRYGSSDHEVGVVVRRRPGLIRLEVHQHGVVSLPSPPWGMPPADQPGGRGLPVVESIATGWGVTEGERPYVWAEFSA